MVIIVVKIIDDDRSHKNVKKKNKITTKTKHDNLTPQVCLHLMTTNVYDDAINFIKQLNATALADDDGINKTANFKLAQIVAGHNKRKSLLTEFCVFYFLCFVSFSSSTSMCCYCCTQAGNSSSSNNKTV